jgi:phage terminase large subunit-like protein
MLRHTKSPFTGKPFIPADWQRDLVIRPLFGWKRKDDNSRRFRRMFCEIPKKNGKSTMCAAIALYLLLGDKEFGAEVYSAATTKDQAKMVFNEAKSMVKRSAFKDLVEPRPIKDSTKVIRFPALEGKYLAVSKDSSGLDGLNASGVIFDELHQLKDAELYNVMTEGSGASRSQPLCVTITTAGSDQTSVCYDEYQAAKKVIEDEKVDEELLGVIFEADDKDDWTDPAVWAKANPNLGVTPKLRDMEHDCKVAQEQVRKQNDFKRRRLNIWTSQLTRWIDMADWKAAARTYTEESLRGLPCFGGLDLSSVIDLTAYVLAFPSDIAVRLWFYLFMPEENIKKASKRDKVPYDQWVKDGYVIATPGNVVDYDRILAKMEETRTFFDLQAISFDPWNASSVATGGAKLNISMVPVSQNFAGISPPCKEFERLLVGKKLWHPNNPCANWAANNVQVRTGPGGVIAPHKPAEKAGQQKRIDPIVGGILSLERIARGVKPQKSAYEEHGVRFL